MIRLRNFLPIVALLAGATIFGAPTRAHAAFMLEYSVNGGAFVVVTQTPTFISTQVDGLTIQATASNSESVPITTIDLGVSGTSSPALNDLLVRAWLSDIPTTPPPQTLTFSFTGSVLPTGTLTEHTWVQSDNVTPFSLSGNLANTGSLAVPAGGSISFNGTVPYATTLESHFSGLSGTNSLSSDNNDSITAANVPAPAGIVLVLSGMPMLGLGAWLRRRKARLTQAA
jgi:hypothetical protein